MSEFLTAEDLELLEPASAVPPSPIPTQVVSNGEFLPGPKTPAQAEVESRIIAVADELAPRHGRNRRGFLASAAGMATAFAAMNTVYGPVFGVDPAEAAEPGAAVRSQMLSRVIEGHAVTLVNFGQVDRDACRRHMISQSDLEGALRQEGLDGLDNVKRMTLEPSGKLCIIKHDPCKPDP
jgi:hypothetical protein